IDHSRRAVLPGVHISVALWLSRGAAYTLPLLELEGRRIADSAAVIEALELRFPERPLYPADAEERRRALALAEGFDQGLGPAAPPLRPVAGPPGAPLPEDIARPAPLVGFGEDLRPRPGFRWVEETYRRYRALPQSPAGT